MKTIRLTLAGLLFSAIVFADCAVPAVSYVSRYTSGSDWGTGFTSPGPIQFTDPSTGVTGLGTPPGYIGAASMIYNVQSFTGNAAIDMALNLPSPNSGYFREILGSSDVNLTGNYYMVNLQSGTISVYQIVGYSSTLLGTAAISVHNGVCIRSVLHKNAYNNQVLEVIVDGISVLVAPAPALTGSGYVGFYLDGGSTYNMMTYVAVEVPDTTPPTAILSNSVTKTIFPNHVDLTWPATTDNTGGSGLLTYQVLKDGTVLATTNQLNYSDQTVSPSETVNYTIRAIDYFFNLADTTFSLTTASIPTNPPYPSVLPEGRQVGVRPTGTYWGAGGERIDVRSGNLNFTMPLLTAKARGGWSTTFNLSYNSQNWRYDTSTNWNYGGDTGYGYGWSLQVGSITPVWNAGGLTAAYYIYSDATGAEYRLDQNTSNVWSSLASAYVWFDANTTMLYFRDGSSWFMGCTSNNANDAGVLYPTLIQDVNGNAIQVKYMNGSGAAWINSSGQIYTITDTRAPAGSYTYMLSYGTSLGISNNIGSGENYTFGQSSAALYSPFNSQSYGNVAMLTSAVLINGTYTFQYNSSGELTRITMPQGGYLRYDYSTVTYSSGRSYREVTSRYLSKNGSTETTYALSHEPSPGTDVHSYTVLSDPGGIGQKYWSFNTTGTFMGLVNQYQGRQLPGPVTLTQNDFTWGQSSGNSFISSVLTTMDVGQSYQAQKKTNQTVDAYGNVTQVQYFNFGNLSTASRTMNYTYVGYPSDFSSHYVFNRLASATVTEGTTTQTLVSNSYGTSYGYGNYGRLTQSQTLTGTRTFTYDLYGNVASTALNGITTSITMDTSTNSAPAQISVGSLTENMTYNTFLGLTNDTGPNGVSTSISYLNVARPSQVTSPYGAYTGFSYTTTTTTATINGRWTRTTTDGLGRPVMVETGTGATTTPPVSITETEYDSCGGSPVGKLKRTSLPHSPGAAALWTTYTYDGIGRTLRVTAPDGVSTTKYTYQGNTVTVTDPAGKWKTYTTDAFGRLTLVKEPDPSATPSTIKALAVKAGMTNSSVSVFAPASGTNVWNYRRALTIDHTKVSGAAALTDIPLFISYTDPSFKSTSNGGNVGKGDGTDIYFTSSDGVTKLAHELEVYDATSGQVTAWVRVPSVSPVTDTTLYMYYGNPTASDQQNRTGVWDTNYKAVWHLPNGSSLSLNDATTNANTGALSNTTTVPRATTGMIGGGASFNGSWEYISVANSTSLSVAGPITLSAWVNVGAFPAAGKWGYVIGKGANASTEAYFLRLENSSGSIKLQAGSYNGSNHMASWVISGWSTGQWHHLAGSYDGTTWRVYFDGAALASTTDATGALSNTKNEFLGATDVNGTMSRYLNGSIDEPRISSVGRSADWILTEYRNQSSPSTFMTLGTEQPANTTQVAAPMFSVDGNSMTLSTITSGATIYYTTDGSTPTTASTVYTGSFPTSTAYYTTTYGYDMLDHLISVSMPRPTGTQTRTFTYNTGANPPGAFLLSATNPENGTVTYTYDYYNRLATKVDAKGQKLVYSYDNYNRLTQVSRYYNGTIEDTQQRTTYYYDVNPFNYFGANLAGRLAGVQYYGGNCTSLGPPRTGCDSILESYNYSQQGSLLGKQVQVTRGFASGTLTSSFTYDNEGRPTNETYPSWSCNGCASVPGSSYNFGYDALGRLNTMTDALASSNVISGVTYGVANEMLSISGILNETRAYNNMFQLTQITVPGVLNMQYAYSPANNSGKIVSQTDVLSGEQITYTYDSLNRLATAITSDNPNVTQWGYGYGYDGFGNLTDQNVIKGSAIPMNVAYNASTNRQTGDTADLNGNIGLNYAYDVENRLLRPGTSGSGAPQYGYDAGNKRIWRSAGDELTFWSGNEKWATYGIAVSGSTVYFTLTGTNVYFGGRLIAKGTYNSGGTNDKVTLSAISTDRLGSVVNNGVSKFYPFGLERPSATTNDKEKFTGYFRDQATGLDYANQRYHQPGVGRFLTPDPYSGSINPNNPGSWGRYAYVGGDPINLTDSLGLDYCWDHMSDYDDGAAAGCWGGGGGGYGIDDSIVGGAGVNVDENGRVYDPGPGESVNVTATPDSITPIYSPIGSDGGGSTQDALDLGVTFSVTGTATSKPKSKSSVSQCMTSHVNDFSILGLVNGITNFASGRNDNYRDNFWANQLLGNTITTAFVGSLEDNTLSGAGLGAEFVNRGMGAATSYGRRTSTILSLNLAGKGGLPMALGRSPLIKSFIGGAAKNLGLYMDLPVRLAIDGAFTLLEFGYCSVR